MKAVIVTLDPRTLVPDQDIQDAVVQAISGRIRIQWLNSVWDFDVTDIIEGNGKNARLAFDDTTGGEKALRIEYERQDGVNVAIEPVAYST